ncbi:putative phage tail protein [Variovorax paradoxus]|uniref:DUF2313 domain-containing protein n=1 Tax=Variovorax paradoxus TaxID=34073 RepID=A0A0H2LX04_VARPD|nr:putative phage tail protein [Variovorax paradoxus]KLN54739.1 hypothetical protein VPARA_40430 [Variovorax paradoxus]
MIERFIQALTYLLPQGFAWPREPDSTLMRVLRAVAGMFDGLHRFTRATVFEWQPATTTTRMAEWEEATGLPDACFGEDQTLEERRFMLLMRLRGPVLPYEDSSPAAPEVIEAMCLAVGYTVTVSYNLPFRVGHRCGKRLGLLDGLLYITVILPAGRMRVGTARVGDRLINGPKTSSDLACLLRRTLPARYAPIFILK